MAGSVASVVKEAEAEVTGAAAAVWVALQAAQAAQAAV